MSIDDERGRRAKHSERYLDFDARIQIERDHIGKILAHYLGGVSAQLPHSKGSLYALSVGCGNGYEAKPILDAFPGIQYKGIDIDGDLLRGARIGVNLDLPVESTKFLAEDGRLIPIDEEGKYGLVVVRHPGVYGESFDVAYVMSLIRVQNINRGNYNREVLPSWKEVFKASAVKLAPGGYLLATTTANEEHQGVLKCLAGSGLSTIVNEPNQASALPSDPFFGDQFIVIARKP